MYLIYLESSAETLQGSCKARKVKGSKQEFPVSDYEK